MNNQDTHETQEIQKVHDIYNLAIEELKQVNDELFYNDLKQKLDDNLQRYEKGYNDILRITIEMDGVIKKIPNHIMVLYEESSEKIINNANEELQQTSERISQKYDEQIEIFSHALYDETINLNNIRATFDVLYHNINASHNSFVEEQKNINEAQSQWLLDANSNLEVHRHQLNKELGEKFDVQLELLTDKLKYQINHIDALYENTITTQKTIKKSIEEANLELMEEIRISKEATMQDNVKSHAMVVYNMNELNKTIKEDIIKGYTSLVDEGNKTRKLHKDIMEQMLADIEEKLGTKEKIFLDKFQQHKDYVNRKNRVLQWNSVAIMLLQVIILIYLYVN